MPLMHVFKRSQGGYRTDGCQAQISRSLFLDSRGGWELRVRPGMLAANSWPINPGARCVLSRAGSDDLHLATGIADEGDWEEQGGRRGELSSRQPESATGPHSCLHGNASISPTTPNLPSHPELHVYYLPPSFVVLWKRLWFCC